MKRLTTTATAEQIKEVTRIARDAGCIVYYDKIMHIKGGHLPLVREQIRTILPTDSFEFYMALYDGNYHTSPASIPALRIKR